EAPDLVHGFTIKSAIYAGLASRLAGVPARVHAVAGLGYIFISGSWRARLLCPLVRGLMRLAFGGRNACLILQNPDDVAAFLDAGLAAARQVRLIEGSGVDCRQFSPGSALDAGGPLRILL